MKIFFFILFYVVPHAQAEFVRDFQTTRLQMTGGNGVGSILLNEAHVLNPATAAFFEQSAMSYQYNKNSLKSENSQRNIDQRFWKESQSKSEGIFISDSAGPVKGGVSAQRQFENAIQRERLTAHMASVIDKSTAVGFSYKHTQDKYSRSRSKRHSTYNEASIGFLHILNEDMSLGLVGEDLTRNNPGNELIRAGIQYRLVEKISLIADYSYLRSGVFGKDYSWGAGAQLTLFTDLHALSGVSYDYVNRLKSFGYGISWIGPKLSIDIAQKTSTPTDDKVNYLYDKERIIDFSVSATVRFE